MTSRRSSRALGLALLLVYSAYLAGVNVYARRSIVIPVVLYVPDVLLGEDEPLLVHAVVLHAATAMPLGDVPLRFVREATAFSRPVDLTAATDPEGAASVLIVESAAPTSSPGITDLVGDRIAVMIAPGSPWVLASPWPTRAGEPRRALAEITEIRAGMRILVVDLDGVLGTGSKARSSPSWPPAPPASFVETVLAESRLGSRTIYLATLDPALEQRCKRWISFSGLSDGSLVPLRRDKSRDAELEAFALRLRSLQATVSFILAGRGVEATYTRNFPESAVKAYE